MVVVRGEQIVEPAADRRFGRFGRCRGATGGRRGHHPRENTRGSLCGVGRGANGCRRRRRIRGDGFVRGPTYRHRGRLGRRAGRASHRSRGSLSSGCLSGGAARTGRRSAVVDGRDLLRRVRQILEQVPQAGIRIVPGVALSRSDIVRRAPRQARWWRRPGFRCSSPCRSPAAEAPRRRPDPQCYETSSEISRNCAKRRARSQC